MRTPSVRAIFAIGIALPALFTAVQPSHAIEVIFDYRMDTRGFFDDPLRRSLLERAAQEYVGPLDGELGALSPPNFRARFPDPETGEMVSVADLSVSEQTLVIFVGARPLLEQDRMAIGGPGYTQFPCTEVIANCWPQMLGQADPQLLREGLFEVVYRGSVRALHFPANAFATWGGSLAFGSDIAWYFGHDSDVPADQFDFLSSAIHELGHVFGIGTAESWSARVPSRRFDGEQSRLAHGGPVPLAEDFGHWENGTLSWARGVPQEAALTPGLAPGQRRWLSELDIAGLRDIGWVSFDPQPVSFVPAVNYAGRRIKGDVDGDGLVSYNDATMIEIQLEMDTAARAAFEMNAELDSEFSDPADIEPLGIGPLDDPLARAAADVFPMEDGNAIGDGVVDERDLELLNAVFDPNNIDFDEDGIATGIENALNGSIWVQILGRPRYQPLMKRTEACIQGLEFLTYWEWMMRAGVATFMYCDRGGTPWGEAPGLAPEECCDGPPPAARTEAVTSEESEIETPTPKIQTVRLEPQPQPESEAKSDAPTFDGFAPLYITIDRDEPSQPVQNHSAPSRSREVATRYEQAPSGFDIELPGSTEPRAALRPPSAVSQLNPVHSPGVETRMSQADPSQPWQSTITALFVALLELIQRFGVWIGSWLG